MNKKDYKEIAEIMKIQNDKSNCGLSHREIFLLDSNHKVVCEELADYFEQQCSITLYNKGLRLSDSVMKKKFNRKQFLKDCGVEE